MTGVICALGQSLPNSTGGGLLPPSFGPEVVGERVPSREPWRSAWPGKSPRWLHWHERTLFKAYEARCYQQSIETHLSSFISWFCNLRCLFFLVIGCFLGRRVLFLWWDSSSLWHGMHLLPPGHWADHVFLFFHLTGDPSSLPTTKLLMTFFFF